MWYSTPGSKPGGTWDPPGDSSEGSHENQCDKGKKRSTQNHHYFLPNFWFIYFFLVKYWIHSPCRASKNPWKKNHSLLELHNNSCLHFRPKKLWLGITDRLHFESSKVREVGNDCSGLHYACGCLFTKYSLSKNAMILRMLPHFHFISPWAESKIWWVALKIIVPVYYYSWPPLYMSDVPKSVCEYCHMGTRWTQ